MKALLLFFAVLAISTTVAVAQKDFRPGYVITLQNDTLSGEVDYRTAGSKYESCLFRRNNQLITYDARQINGYGFWRDRYFAAGVVEGAFAEVLVRGELSLFKHGDGFFVRKSGGEVRKLESRETQMTIDGKVGMKKDLRWKGMIYYLISDCIGDPDRIKGLGLKEKGLTEIVVDYNKCRQTGFKAYKEAKPWTRLEVGAAFGWNRSEINVDRPDSRPFLVRKYTSIDPFLGVVFEISSPRITERVAFQPEIQFSKSDFSSLSSVGGQASRVYHDTFISLTTVSIPMAFRYSFSERRNSIRVFAGVNLDYHLKSEALVVSELVSGSVVKTYENEPFEIYESQFGYWGGLSVMRSFKKVRTGVGIRYIQMSTLNTVDVVRTSHNKFSIFLILQKQ